MFQDALYRSVLLCPLGDGLSDKRFYDRRFLKVAPYKNHAVYLKRDKLYD